MTSGRRLTRNIRVWLRDRRIKAKDLAFFCRHSKPWVTRLLQDKHKKIAWKDVDCIAEFFEVDVTDLFRAERRKSKTSYAGVERRNGKDRREG